MAKQKKVLVVEDDRFLANAYKVGFEGEGFQVELAMDGDEAINLATAETPDLILLDIMLPKKDGFTVLQELKADANLKKVPVVVASNLGQPNDIEKGTKLGAVDYIVKSESSITEILQKIRKLMK